MKWSFETETRIVSTPILLGWSAKSLQVFSACEHNYWSLEAEGEVTASFPLDEHPDCKFSKEICRACGGLRFAIDGPAESLKDIFSGCEIKQKPRFPGTLIKDEVGKLSESEAKEMLVGGVIVTALQTQGQMKKAHSRANAVRCGDGLVKLEVFVRGLSSRVDGITQNQ